MAASTVTDRTRSTSTANVKSESKFWQRWRRSAPAAHAPQSEPDTFPHPDAQTQVLPPPPHRPHVAPSATVHGSHPGDLFTRLQHLLVDLAADPAVDCRRAIAALNGPMSDLQQRAKAEANYDRRAPKAAAQAAQNGRDLAAAARVPGVQVHTEHTEQGLEYVPAIVDRMLADAKRASDPAPTAQFPVITDGMADPRKAAPELVVTQSGPGGVVLTVVSGVPASPSPVRHDETTPPVPDEPVPGAKRLPRREPRAGQDEAPEGGASK